MSRFSLLPLLFFAPLLAAQPKKEPKKDAPPAVRYAVPLFPKVGGKQKISLRGANLDAATGVTASDPTVTVTFLAAKKAALPNNAPKGRLGDTEVEIELELPKGTKPGVTLTVTGPAGASAPYALAIPTDLPRVSEKEPNDGFAAAQAIPVPCEVVGAVGRDRDADVFKVTGKAGERLRFEVQAAKFGGPLDGLLMLHDAAGRLIDSCDDVGGNPDPSLAVTLPRDGSYFLSLLDAHDLGGPAHGYRILATRAE
jgi:hypothetical protein